MLSLAISQSLRLAVAYRLGVGLRMTASLKTSCWLTIQACFYACCFGIPGHYVLKQSSGTNPGQESEIRYCPGDSGTVGNYVINRT